MSEEKKTRKPKAATAESESSTFKADAYQIVTMKRSELKSAAYNPRVINDTEKKKLRAGLKKHKMVQPPTWNKRSGILVGGHQRLSQLDVLAGGKDYELQVAVIDVTEAEEKEINILLNNSMAQGTWDLPKLEDLLRDPGIDIFGTGFDQLDVERLFGSFPKEEELDVAAQLANGMEYRVVVDCTDELQQTELLDRFGNEGLKCRALIS